MKLFEENNYYVVVDEDGRAIGGGDTPLKAICSAANEYYTPGSFFWHLCVAEVIRESDPMILNHWQDPFSEA